MKNSIDMQIQETIQGMLDYYKSHSTSNRVVVIPFLQDSITYIESLKNSDLTSNSSGQRAALRHDAAE